MRVRRQSAIGDMTFGAGVANFYSNDPAGVGQAVGTRLGLWTGQWFLDFTAGTPWATAVLGKGTTSSYDAVITSRIQGTPGLLQIIRYSSNLDVTTRALSFSAEVSTLYGTTNVANTLVI
jgi:hypothetical protein